MMHASQRLSSLFAILMIMSCRTATNSSIQVTNGQLDLGDQGVFMIQGEDPETKALSLCTASLIKANILLTAAHCVQNRLTGQYRFIKLASSAGLHSVDIKIHPQYTGKSRFDAALIKLNGEVKNITPLTIAVKSPQKDEQVRLVGFGGNQYTLTKGIVKGSGVKRTGTSRITNLDDHFIYSRGTRDAVAKGATQPTGQDVALARGDSGGPLFNAAGAIIGIAAQTNSTDDNSENGLSVISAHTSITVLADFIKEYLASSISDSQ